MLELIIITIFVGAVTLIANLAELRPSLRPIVILAAVSLSGVILLNDAAEVYISTLSEQQQQDFLETTLKTESTFASFIVTLITLSIATLLLWDRFRWWIAPLFPKPGVQDELPMITIQGDEIAMEARQLIATRNEILGFRPESMVHMWAAILCVNFFGLQIAAFVQAGGLEGVGEDLKVDYGSLIANFILMLIVPMIGVGLFTRRDFRASLQRLGLTRMDLKSMIASVAISFMLLCGLYMLVTVWILIVSPEAFEEQNEASGALAESITSIGLAFTVAFTAAVGEEIAFRGGLQPIFGLWATAIIFTLVHIQYTLTPATLIIFMVAVTLGYVRRYFNTTTAIVIHFLYNLVQLLLTVAANSAFLWILK